MSFGNIGRRTSPRDYFALGTGLLAGGLIWRAHLAAWLLAPVALFLSLVLRRLVGGLLEQARPCRRRPVAPRPPGTGAGPQTPPARGVLPSRPARQHPSGEGR